VWSGFTGESLLKQHQHQLNFFKNAPEITLLETLKADPSTACTKTSIEDIISGKVRLTFILHIISSLNLLHANLVKVFPIYLLQL
jgi:hypothetical protein